LIAFGCGPFRAVAKVFAPKINAPASYNRKDKLTLTGEGRILPPRSHAHQPCDVHVKRTLPDKGWCGRAVRNRCHYPTTNSSGISKADPVGLHVHLAAAGFVEQCDGFFSAQAFPRDSSRLALRDARCDPCPR